MPALPDDATEMLSQDKEEALRWRLRKLRGLAAEVADLEQRTLKQRRLRASGAADLDTICANAARLPSSGPPVQFPLRPTGFPAAPLPHGFSLPCPTIKEAAKASAINAAAQRAPPPKVEVAPAKDRGGSRSGEAAPVWEARVEVVPPAEVALLTRDGSLPRPNNPAARSVHSEGAKVPLAPGSLLYVAAFAKGLRRSDVVTVVVPKSKPKAAAPAPPSARGSVGRAPATLGALAHSAPEGSGRAAVQGTDRRRHLPGEELLATSHAAPASAEAAASRDVPHEAEPLPTPEPDEPPQPIAIPLGRQTPGAPRRAKKAADFRSSLLLTPGMGDSDSDESE